MESSTKIVNEIKVAHFLESGEFWDEVTFEFDDGKKLYVSQNFLSLASPVFKAMFENDFEEKRTKTVKLVGKVFGDVLELLKCLHPNIQKRVTFDNVLNVSAIAEEYQCYLISKRCKAKMSKYLQSEKQRAIDIHSPIEKYECALTCLKLLIEADKLNYHLQLSEAVNVIARFNFRYFTGTVLCQKPIINKGQQSGSNLGVPTTGFCFGTRTAAATSCRFSLGTATAAATSTGLGLGTRTTAATSGGLSLGTATAAATSKASFANMNSLLTPSRRIEDVAEDCKKLYESLSEKLKCSLLMKRLYQCDII